MQFNLLNPKLVGHTKTRKKEQSCSILGHNGVAHLKGSMVGPVMPLQTADSEQDHGESSFHK